MATDPLAVYLNDHLAGSRSALQLLDGLIESTRDAKARGLLDGVRREIEEDRAVLETVIRRVSGAPSVVREVGGWVAEKLARLKLAVDDPSDGALRRLEALEILALGIQGKGGLWRALSMAAAVPELGQLNFGDLVRRAAEQYARVEDLRLEAARIALNYPRNVTFTQEPARKR